MRWRYRLSCFVFLPQQAPFAPLSPLRAPTWITSSFITCRQAFSQFLSVLFLGKAFFPQTFVLVGLFKICTYEHVVVEHHTAQQNAVTPAQISKANTCRQERDNTCKQTELTRASISSSIYTARRVLETKEEKEIYPANMYYSQGVWLKLV